MTPQSVVLGAEGGILAIPGHQGREPHPDLRTRHCPLPGKSRSASQNSRQIPARFPDRTDPRRGGWQSWRGRGAPH